MNQTFYKIAILGSNTKPFTYFSSNHIDDLVIVEVPLNKRVVRGVVIEKVEEPTFECNEISLITQSFFSQYQALCAKFISEYYSSSLGVALNIFTPFLAPFLEYEKIEVLNSPKLSQKQQIAFEFVDKNRRSLLFGDTGSGKTEIYISMIIKVLREGKNAIFLLPEIGLTPQLESRLVAYFGDMVGIWHSKVTKKRKEDMLKSLSSGEIRVIIGARSALFLPLSNIGLIIVDEEHDDSYKSGQTPRYNARDIALYYGMKMDSRVILGSATPSITSIYKIPYTRLKGGYYESNKKIVYEDVINELSFDVIEEIKSAVAKKEQVIIFLPTRAHFKYISCKNCSEIILCPFCSVALSLHKDKNLLKCHYCNYVSRIIETCPRCQSQTMQSTRLGTSEVVDRLREELDGVVIEKFDRDEITTQRKLNKTLSDFKSQKIDILVGTQMLSKGHDYHKVGLCVILGIDNVLATNDFRAREKALSLAIQIAGRSGRREEGRVFIQSKNQEFFKKFINDYDSFAKDELRLREGLYPPYTKLLRLIISHKFDKDAQDVMHSSLKILESLMEVEIVGYGKAGIEKIANKYRYNILLRSTRVKPLLYAAAMCKNINIQIDIDPISFS